MQAYKNARSILTAICIAGLGLLFVRTEALANVRLAFDSTSLDFGSVAVLGTRDLTISVTNTSGSDIQIDAITAIGSDAGDFTILSPGTPFVVRSGQSTPSQIIIQFRPRAVGTRTASLTLETSDGEVVIPMTGIGTGNASSLRWSFTTVDFGSIAPYGGRDSIIELYSDGTDTAFVTGLEIAGPDTSFSASVVGGSQPPLALAPGDSVAVNIGLYGLPPAGSKFAQLSAVGSTKNTPACNLSATVQYAGFAIQPDSMIDFGSMYDGQVRDTTVLLIDTTSLDLDIELLDLSPAAQDFSIENPPPLPYTLHAGDTLRLLLRANPGAGLDTFSTLQIVSPSAAVRFGSRALMVRARQARISAPTFDSLAYYCADTSLVHYSIAVRNSDTETIMITGARFSDSTIGIQSQESFPAAIPPGDSQIFNFLFDPAAASSSPLRLELLGGERIMWADTLEVRATAESASPVLTSVSDSGTIQTEAIGSSISLSAFGLDSMVIHLSSSDTNGATIDPSSIRLDSSLLGDSIAAITPETGGFRIVIVSDSQISAPAGIPIVHFRFYRFISAGDSAALQVSIETPDRADCIAWSVATLRADSTGTCGETYIQNVLASKPIILEAVLSPNPVEASTAYVRIRASAEDDCHYAISNALGGLVSTGSFLLHKGTNELSLSLAGAPGGTYWLDLLPDSGTAKLLPFTQIR